MMQRAFVPAILLAALLSACGSGDGLVVEKEVTGAETNCYLVYDPESGEAALFDVGGPIEGHLKSIADKGLDLRYLVITHEHPDHYVGLPPILEQFPDAKLCMHRDGFENLPLLDDWARGFYPPNLIRQWEKDPVMSWIVNFDEKSLGEPDIFIEDKQRLPLGADWLVAFHSPGHSEGSVCFYADGRLLSGDVLFQGNVGRVDLLEGSREDQVESVRRLYETLPPDTEVLPGHGPPTTIGAEREGNRSITMNEVHL